MIELLITIMEIMMSMSLCIVFISGMKRIFGNRYGFKFRYLLWYVIAIRLLIPFNFTLPNSLQINQPNLPVLRITSPNGTSGLEVATKQVVINTFEDAATMDTLGREISIINILVVLSLSVSLILFLFQFYKYLQFKKYINQYKTEPSEEIWTVFNDVKQTMSIKKNIPIYVLDELSSPMLLGLFSPFVVLPNINLDTKQIEMVCSHELMHYKRHDILFKWLLLSVKCLYWFNPIIGLLYNEADKDIELSCDEAILKDKSLDYCKLYGRTILEVLRNQTSSPEITLSTCFNTNKYTVKERIVSLLNTSKKRLSNKAVIGIMTIVLMSSMLVSCTTSTINMGVKNRSIDKLETVDSIEYYFTIYNKKFGVRVSKDAPFIISVPTIVEEDTVTMSKGDILFEFVDKNSGDVYKKYLFGIKPHPTMDLEYNRDEIYLYSYEALNDDVDDILRDYVTYHDEVYITIDSIAESLSSCVYVREKENGQIDVEVRIQNNDLTAGFPYSISLPEDIINPDISIDDRIKSNERALDVCQTIDVEAGNISTMVVAYDNKDVNTLIEELKRMSIDVMGPNNTSIKIQGFDNIVHFTKDFEVLENYVKDIE